MKLNAISQAIVAAGVVGMLLLVIGMIYSAHTNTELADQEGSFEKTVEVLDGAGLRVSAVRLVDVYGDNYVAAAVVCPGETRESVAAKFNIDASKLHLPTKPVPEQYNYLLLSDNTEDFRVERLDRSLVDLCTQKEQSFRADSLLPLQKAKNGAWNLVS